MIGNISAASDIQNLIIFRHLEVIFTLAWMSLEDGERGGVELIKKLGYLYIVVIPVCFFVCQIITDKPLTEFP